ncbi:MAG: hypothetical protein LRY71_07225 [Bacillaceae bacterium]|nr:hypothetical protein [Bacillaceae bacterium]
MTILGEWISKTYPNVYTKSDEAYEKGLIKNRNKLLAVIENLKIVSAATLKNSALVHGDLNFRNFLVDNNGKLTG